MRISGGTARGRKVRVQRAFSKSDSRDELRPTSAKVRKAIFDILGERILGCIFLDLYAGTGAVGIEALSRGAGSTTLVDDNPVRVKIIRELIDKLGFTAQAEVLRDRAARFLSSPTTSLLRGRAQKTYDVIFIDPPYASGEIEVVLPLIDDRGILSQEGTVIVEHTSKKSLPSDVGSLCLKKSYRYGDTSLTFYRKASETGASA